MRELLEAIGIGWGLLFSRNVADGPWTVIHHGKERTFPTDTEARAFVATLGPSFLMCSITTMTIKVYPNG